MSGVNQNTGSPQSQTTKIIYIINPFLIEQDKKFKKKNQFKFLLYFYLNNLYMNLYDFKYFKLDFK